MFPPKRISRLADFVTLIMVPVLFLSIDTAEAQQSFVAQYMLTLGILVAAFFTALMAVFSTGFALLSRWCALAAGLVALGSLNTVMRGAELPVAAVYLALQILIPRAIDTGVEDASVDSSPAAVTAVSNFSDVSHREPAKPLAKEDLWKRSLYTAERVRNNWTLRLAERRFPPLTLALIVLAVAAFVAGWSIAPTGLRRISALWHGLFPLAASDALVWPGVWRALSVTLLAWSASQLVLNTLLLLMFGRVLEPSLGPRRFAAYAAVGAAAGIAGAALRPHGLQVGAGLTGVVAALAGATITLNLLHFRRLDLGGKQRFFMQTAMLTIVVAFALESGLSAFSPVSHAAAAGGLLAGVALVVVAGPHYAAVPDPRLPNRLTPRARSILGLLGFNPKA